MSKLFDDNNEYNLSSAFGVNRFVNAESWWIASQLARRHPELLVYEMHPGGGQYDVLCVARPEELATSAPGSSPKIMINRAGSIQVHDAERSVVVATWEQVLTSAHPHSAVLEIERHAKLTAPRVTPKAAPRTLTYRVIAGILQVLVNDKQPWDVRCESFDSSGMSSEDHGYINSFPAAASSAVSTPRLGIYGEPTSHFWTLLRGKKPVAMLSIEGQFFPAHGEGSSLMDLYDSEGRNVRKTVAALLDTVGT